MELLQGTAKLLKNVPYLLSSRLRFEVGLTFQTITFNDSFKVEDGTKAVLSLQKDRCVLCSSIESIIKYSVNAGCSYDLSTSENLKFYTTLKRDFSGNFLEKKMIVLMKNSSSGSTIAEGVLLFNECASLSQPAVLMVALSAPYNSAKVAMLTIIVTCCSIRESQTTNRIISVITTRLPQNDHGKLYCHLNIPTDSPVYLGNSSPTSERIARLINEDEAKMSPSVDITGKLNGLDCREAPNKPLITHAPCPNDVFRAKRPIVTPPQFADDCALGQLDNGYIESISTDIIEGTHVLLQNIISEDESRNASISLFQNCISISPLIDAHVIPEDLSVYENPTTTTSPYVFSSISRNNLFEVLTVIFS